jgi:hypothetical protein
MNNHVDNNNNLIVFIQHGVNAILPLQRLESSSESSTVPSRQRDYETASCPLTQPADIVLFNHPHLGVEDANLHAYFLAHLLDSVNRYWLKKLCNSSQNNYYQQHDSNASGHHRGGLGIFFLTLALGQWERWKGDDAAARLGWFIVNRLPFQTPLEKNASTAGDGVDEKPYFQLRRHQTGKSFANRRKANTSETFALGRLAEKELLERQDSPSPARLFWYSHSDSIPTQSVNTTETTTTTTFACPFCDRTFCEQRSVKNHIRCKHPNQDQPHQRNGKEGVEERNKNHENEHAQSQQRQKEWECPYCSNCRNDDTSSIASYHLSKRQRRIFQNQQALQDHIKAKHHALHSKIPPDYQMPSTAIADVSDEPQSDSLVATRGASQQPVEHCDVCLAVFATAQEERHHMDRFIPPPTTTSTTTTTTHVSSKLETTVLMPFACTFCAKAFREKRARLRKCSVVVPPMP